MKHGRDEDNDKNSNKEPRILRDIPPDMVQIISEMDGNLSTWMRLRGVNKDYRRILEETWFLEETNWKARFIVSENYIRRRPPNVLRAIKHLTLRLDMPPLNNIKVRKEFAEDISMLNQLETLEIYYVYATDPDEYNFDQGELLLTYLKNLNKLKKLSIHNLCVSSIEGAEKRQLIPGYIDLSQSSIQKLFLDVYYLWQYDIYTPCSPQFILPRHMDCVEVILRPSLLNQSIFVKLPIQYDQRNEIKHLIVRSLESNDEAQLPYFLYIQDQCKHLTLKNVYIRFAMPVVINNRYFIQHLEFEHVGFEPMWYDQVEMEHITCRDSTLLIVKDIYNYILKTEKNPSMKRLKTITCYKTAITDIFLDMLKQHNIEFIPLIKK